MFDYTVRYEKKLRARYVSHLDFVRSFNRAMRRADLPVAFSEGFNQHPKLSFAMALSIFYESDCELLEVEMTQDIAPDVLMERLNGALGEGIRVTRVTRGKSRMKALTFALYSVCCEKLPQSVEGFLGMNEILINKKTKSGIRETDIRADIHSITLKDDCIEMILSSGNSANLKPDVVMAAMNKYIKGYESGACRYTRKALLDGSLEEI